jgi:SAM-dependent methyltransferase
MMKDPESYDFAVCKNCGSPTASPRYRLRDGLVWVCRGCGLHYIDYLDPVVQWDGEVDREELTPRRRAYLKSRYQNNPKRFHRHLDFVRRFRTLRDLRVLDVGSGGGFFLSAVNREGGDGMGAELWDPAVSFARETFGLTVHKYPVEHPFWRNNYSGAFDVVTLWDVIEHVNFPLETLRAVRVLLGNGGLVFVATPCRDGFFHRFGTVTYRITAGRFPTTLNMLYSKDPFGHKQIISTAEMGEMFHRSGFNMIGADKMCELSAPCGDYIFKYFSSRTLARLLGPPAEAFVGVTHVRNKMVVVGLKK